MASLIKWFKDRRDDVVDVFDANTARDKQRRYQQQVQQTQPGQRMPRPGDATVQSYSAQQKAMGNKRPYTNIGQQLVGNTARFTNTLAAAIPEVYGTVAQTSATLTKNADAIRNANAFLKAHHENVYRPDSGVLKAGTIFDSPEEFNTLGAKELTKRMALTTGGTGAELLPFTKVARPVAGSSKVALMGNKLQTSNKVIKGIAAAQNGTKILPKVGYNAAESAIGGLGESAGRQYATTGKIDPKILAGDTLANTLLGGAVPSVGAAGRKTAQQFQGTPLTKELIAERNDLVNKYNKAKATGKNQATVEWAAKRIEEIDNSTKAPVSRAIDKKIPRVDADGPNPYGLPSNTPGSSLPSTPQTKLNASSDSIIDPMQRVFDANPDLPTNRVRQSLPGTGHLGTTSQTPRSPQSVSAPTPPKGTSPPQLPVSSADNLLPKELTVKKTGMLDKAFRSTRSVIERQGKTGKQLADMLQGSRDTEEILQASVLGRLKNVTSLKGKDYENFIDSVEGNAQPNSPKIAQAVNEWRAVAPEIRERAVKAGVDVGDLGPTYYPHVVDYDKLFNNRNDLNIAINHLIKSGQADTPETAIQLLRQASEVSRNRRMGNLEASRIVDVPIYDKTRNSLTGYISGATRRIAQSETFGAKDEKALEMLANIAREGGDTSAATDAFNIAVGAKKYGAAGEKVSNNARKYISTTRLGLGAITNSSQSVNTGVVTGHLRTMGAMLKQLDPQQRKFVEQTGVVADAVINEIRENTGFSGKVLNKITAPGFGSVEKFNRSVAAVAGRDYAQSLAKKGDVDTLKNKLGVRGKIGTTLTPEQEIQAARKVVEKTQFKVDAQDLPGWVSSPGGKLVAQFRTFSYNQSKFFSNEILKPAAKGNLVPTGRMLAALPLGYTIYETKRVLNNREETDGNVRKGIEAFGSIGGAGLVVDIFKGMQPLNGKYLDSGRRVSMAVGTFGGPAASTAADLVGSISDAVQPKNIPENNPTLEGKAGIRKGDEYFDATQLSRFGMRQIPIVGTRLQNTFLPYTSKKKDEKKPANNSVSTSDTDRGQKQNTTDPSRTDYITKTQLKSANLETKLHRDLSPEDSKVILEYNRLKPAGKEKFNQDLNRVYKYKQAELNRDNLDGKLTDGSLVKRQKELDRLKIDKDYEPNIRDLYKLAKADTFATVSKDVNGQKLAERLLAYDKSLFDAGLTKYMKYRNGLAPATSKSARRKTGGTSRSKGGRRKAVPTEKLNLSMGTPRVANVRAARSIAVNAPKSNFKKPRLAIQKAKKLTPLKTNRA